MDKGLGPSPWSADSYEFTLTLAYIYPFASLFIVWILTGQNTSGISALLPENLGLGRAVAVTAMFVLTFLNYQVLSSSGWRRWAYLAFSSVVVGVVAVAGAALSTMAIAMVVAIVVAGAVAGAIVGVGGVTRVIVIAIAVCGAVGGAGGAGGAIVVAGVGAGLHYMTKLGLKGFYFLLLSLTFCLLALWCSHPAWLGSRQEASGSLIFLVLLPLINSIFDWLSLASTRWLLKNIVVRDYASAFLLAGNAITGLGIGVLLLAGLAVTITAAVQTMNLLSQTHDGPELFDLAGSLHRLRTNPSDVSVWWVYFTLFSTMLPTVFHATVASASFVTWRMPDSWKIHWLNLIDPANNKEIKDDHPLLVGMSWCLTGIDVLTVILAALATAVLAWLLFWLMPHEGRGLLWLCEKVAEWLGAPITV